MPSINEADRQILADLEAVGERLAAVRAASGNVMFGHDEVIEQVLLAILVLKDRIGRTQSLGLAVSAGSVILLAAA